jgi:hypothetical protein
MKKIFSSATIALLTVAMLCFSQPAFAVNIDLGSLGKALKDIGGGSGSAAKSHTYSHSSGMPAGIDGRIDHDVHHAGQGGTCSVEKLPENEAEFDALQSQVGTEPQGAVMVMLAAMNLYVHDEQAGLICLKKAMYDSYSSDMQRLKDKLRPSSPSDNYAQTFLPMAFFRGATPENNYKPSMPYTVEVHVNDARPYSTLTEARAPVIYLNLLTKGTDSGLRPVEVIKARGKPYFTIFNTAGLTSQVKFPVGN